MGADLDTAALIGLVRDQAEATARTAVELRALGDRVGGVEAEVRLQTPLLARLVVLHESRDAREAAVEKRAELELADRAARAAWVRTQLDRLASPAVGAVALVLSTVGAGFAAWFGGLFPTTGGRP